MAKVHNQFSGHHHHHHHHHTHYEYKRPNHITTDLGLFALKKLDAMNPDFLKVKEKRLLSSVAPGVLTHLGYSGLIFANVAYISYVWQAHGLKKFLQPKVFLPLAAMTITLNVYNRGINYTR